MKIQNYKDGYIDKRNGRYYYVAAGVTHGPFNRVGALVRDYEQGESKKAAKAAQAKQRRAARQAAKAKAEQMAQDATEQVSSP